MSNHLAVATVTYSLAQLLQPAAGVVGNGRVATGPPTAEQPASGRPEIRLFLFRAEPNAAWRNDDLPTRPAAGDRTVRRPQAALDLDYILSFYGDDERLEPQQLLGATVSTLHRQPLLDRQLILNAAQADGSPVSATDLGDQPETVRVTPLMLDLEEFSKIWSVYFQTPYRLSIAYRASVVLISPDEPASPALPVTERRLYTTTISRPTIEAVVPAAGATVPVVVTTPMRITGAQLRGELTSVWFGSERVDPNPTDVSDTEVLIDVPPSVRAGLSGVRIEHRRLLGDPPSERLAGSSGIAPLVIRPTIRPGGGGHLVAYTPPATSNDPGSLQVVVDPPVGRRQRVVILLTSTTPAAEQPPASFSYPAPSRDDPTGPDETNTLTVPVPGLPADTYLVRVQVDGADSPLQRDSDPTSATFEQYVSPLVVVP